MLASIVRSMTIAYCSIVTFAFLPFRIRCSIVAVRARKFPGSAREEKSSGKIAKNQPTATTHQKKHHRRHHHPPPMSLLRDNKWSGILTSGLVAFSSGITLYLLISDTARRTEIRRRKNALTTADDVSTAATERFAALRIGGRFVNPFEEYLPWFEEEGADVLDGGSKGRGNGLCGRS